MRSRQSGSAVEPALRIHAFADSARFARQLARAVEAECVGVATRRFPDGETLVRIGAPAGRCAVLVRSLHQPDTKLVETLLAGDALRRAGARRVILVAPYLPYMRQDAVFSPGEPVSQRVVGEMLGCEFDRVLTVEAHLHRLPRLADAFGRGARSISAAPAVAAWIRSARTYQLVVGPDGESEPWVRAIAKTAQLPWAVGRKERLGDRAVRVDFPRLPQVARAVLVDDIASSGATLAVAARALNMQGVRTIDAVVVHAIFAPGSLGRLRRAGIRRVVSCDTVPHPTNAIRCAGLFAASLSTARP